jgi:hypothetical protein
MRFVGLRWLPVFLLAGGAAIAEPCQIDLRPAGDNLGYRHRPTPDRWEGFYSAPVAGEELEVLSFVIGRSELDRQTDHDLLITAPDVHILGAPRVVVVARALPLRVYYRMCVTLPSAGSMQWPVGEVVLPAGLDPRNIGLIGMVQTGDGSIYVPLRLSVLKPDASDGASRPVITFRTPSDLVSFHWRVYAAGGTVPAWNKYDRTVRAGDPIALTLDTPIGRVMTLDVAARPVGSEFVQSRLKIFRP